MNKTVSLYQRLPFDLDHYLIFKQNQIFFATTGTIFSMHSVGSGTSKKNSYTEVFRLLLFVTMICSVFVKRF